MSTLSSDSIVALFKANQKSLSDSFWHVLHTAGFEDTKGELESFLNINSEFTLCMWVDANYEKIDDNDLVQASKAKALLREDFCKFNGLDWPNEQMSKRIDVIINRYIHIVKQGVNDELTANQVSTAHARFFLKFCFDLDGNEQAIIKLLKPTEDMLNRLGAANFKGLYNCINH